MNHLQARLADARILIQETLASPHAGGVFECQAITAGIMPKNLRGQLDFILLLDMQDVPATTPHTRLILLADALCYTALEKEVQKIWHELCPEIEVGISSDEFFQGQTTDQLSYEESEACFSRYILELQAALEIALYPTPVQVSSVFGFDKVEGACAWEDACIGATKEKVFNYGTWA
jgi:hypothetical protein